MNTLTKTSGHTYPNIAGRASTKAGRAGVCKRVIARDGRELVLRQIRANDVAALQRGFTHLSAEEVRMRFLHPLAELPQVLAESLCDLDPGRAVAWVLADPDGVAEPEIHAVARAHVDAATEQAEFAVVVQQQLCGQGFGTLLTQLAIDDARRLGAVEVWGDILLDNAAMQRLCDSFGFERQMVPHHPGVQRATLVL
jgi:RimJ/RimL family protein N-acetyltransferase